MRDNPRIRTIEDFQNDSERVREFYRGQGEERERAKQAHPSSFNNIAFDTGVIAERQRVLTYINAVRSNATGEVAKLLWDLAVAIGSPVEESK